MHDMNETNVPEQSSGQILYLGPSHSVREQERARIALDLHDEVGGNLSAIKLALSTLIERLPSDPYLTDQADYLNELVNHSIVSLKRLYNDLRPAVLDFGLIAALEWQVKEFCKQQKMSCTLTIEPESSRLAVGQLNEDQAMALFRICQEALTNTSKHSNASCVGVTLQLHVRILTLAIKDNGVGSSSFRPAGMGLTGMRERSTEIGAAFEIVSNQNGTLVSTSLTLPCMITHHGDVL